MQRPTKVFSPADRLQIAHAVVQAESNTSAEIVAAIAATSGRYDRAEDIVGLWTGMALLAFVWVLWPIEVPEHGSWHEPWPIMQLVALLLALLVGFLIGTVCATYWGWLRRLFTPWRQMRDETRTRAVQVFYDRRVTRTVGRSGMLLYVSLFERMAVVLADQGILDRIGHEGVEALCEQLRTRLATGTPISALCETIATAGQKLAPVLPRAADDQNELSDALVLID